MPVILEHDSHDLWLDPGITHVEAISELLNPYAGTMRRYPVSPRINNVVNDDAAFSMPVELLQHQGHLF